jgi:hypothetical protein
MSALNNIGMRLDGVLDARSQAISHCFDGNGYLVRPDVRVLLDSVFLWIGLN